MKNTTVLFLIICTNLHVLNAQIKDPLGTSTKVSPAKNVIKEAAKDGQDNKNAAMQTANDTKIAAEIREQFLKQATLKTASIVVEVKEGVVTLKGKVKANEQKNLAESISNKIAGIKSLQNKLEVEIKKK